MYATSLTTYAIDIEADNKNEAYQMANEADGGDFKTLDYGDWDIEVDTIKELN